MPAAANESGPFRIKDNKTGHEYTVAAIYEGDDCTVLDQAAVDGDGNYLAPKYAEPKKAAQTKEASK